MAAKKRAAQKKAVKKAVKRNTGLLGKAVKQIDSRGAKVRRLLDSL